MAEQKDKVRLVYFNGRGRGEPIRIILSIGNVPYDDEIVTFEEWPTIKPSKI